MHVYILFAHPSRESFCRSVLWTFTRGLTAAGHTFEIGDLYEMGFASEMDTVQYRREVGMIPDAPVPEDVRAEQRHSRVRVKRAIVICTAGHTVEHLEETGIADAIRRIMLNDRLLGVGIGEAAMVGYGQADNARRGIHETSIHIVPGCAGRCGVLVDGV